MLLPSEYSLGLLLAWVFSAFEMFYFLYKFAVYPTSKRDYDNLIFSIFCFIFSCILLSLDILDFAGISYDSVISNLQGLARGLNHTGLNVLGFYYNAAIFGVLHGVITETAGLVFMVINFLGGTVGTTVFLATGLARAMYRTELGLACAGIQLANSIILLAKVYGILAVFSTAVFPLCYVIGSGLLPCWNLRGLGISLLVFSVIVGVFMPYLLVNLAKSYDFVSYRFNESIPTGLGWLCIRPRVLIPTRDGFVKVRAPPLTIVKLRGMVEYLNGSKEFVDFSFLVNTYERYVIVPTGTYNSTGFINTYHFHNSLCSSINVTPAKLDYGTDIEHLLNMTRIRPPPGDKVAVLECYPKSIYKNGTRVFFSDSANLGWIDLSPGWVCTTVPRNPLKNYLTCPHFKAELWRNETVKAYGFYVIDSVKPARVLDENGTEFYVYPTVIEKVDYIGVIDGEEYYRRFCTTVEYYGFTVGSIDCLWDVVGLDISEDDFEFLRDRGLIKRNFTYVIKWWLVDPVVRCYSHPHELIVSINYPEECEILEPATIEIHGEGLLRCYIFSFVMYKCEDRRILFNPSPMESGWKRLDLYANESWIITFECNDFDRMLVEGSWFEPIQLMIYSHFQVYELLIRSFITIICCFMAADVFSTMLGGVGVSSPIVDFIKKTRFYSTIASAITGATYSFIDLIFMRRYSGRVSASSLVKMGVAREMALAMAEELRKRHSLDSGRIKSVVKSAILKKAIKKAYDIYRFTVTFRYPVTGALYTSSIIARKLAIHRGSPRLWNIAGYLRTTAFLSTRRPIDLAILSTTLTVKKTLDMRRSEKLSRIVKAEKDLLYNLARSNLTFDQKLYISRRLYEGRLYSIPFDIKGLREYVKLYDEYLRRIDDVISGFKIEGARSLLEEVKDSIALSWTTPYLKQVVSGDRSTVYGYIVERFERSLPNVPSLSLDVLDDFRRNYILGLQHSLSVSDRDIGLHLMKCQQGIDYAFNLGVLRGYYLMKGLEHEFAVIESKLEGSYIGFPAVFGETVEVEETREGEEERKVEEVREEERDLLLEAIFEAILSEFKVFDECSSTMERLSREYVRVKEAIADAFEEIQHTYYAGVQRRYDLIAREEAEHTMNVLQQLIEYRDRLAEMRDVYRLAYDRGYSHVPDEAKHVYVKYKEVLMDMENTLYYLDMIIRDISRFLGDILGEGYEV